MKVKLHRCRNLWVKLDSHPCWRVQRELDAARVDYEIVPGPVRRSKRHDLVALSGQRLYPVIEDAHGRIYRAESKDMAARIRAGHLLGALHGHDEPHMHDTESM
jgi:glutathione S-transferase